MTRVTPQTASAFIATSSFFPSSFLESAFRLPISPFTPFCGLYPSLLFHRSRFLLHWANEFNEELEPGALDERVIPSSLCEDFTGLRFRRVNETTIEITCSGAIKSLEELLRDHPLPTGMHASCPLSPEALTALASEVLPSALAAQVRAPFSRTSSRLPRRTGTG